MSRATGTSFSGTASVALRTSSAIVGLIVGLLLLILLLKLYSDSLPLKPYDDSDSIALGAYISEAPSDPTRMDEFTSMVGTAPAVVMWYQDWGDRDDREFQPFLMETVNSSGAMPMITWEPQDPANGDELQSEYALERIVDGDHDAYMRRWARDAAAWGQPMYLRFAHEMNGNWYPWSPGVNGNTSQEYVGAWRHVHDIFQQEGAANVRWVWSPNVAEDYSIPFTEVYPGDEYVDWVALDGYNWGMTQPSEGWKELIDIFEPSYKQLTAITNKPMMIAETASAESGGSKAAWIRQGLLNDVPSRLPQARAVIWFDEIKEGADWRVNSSSASLAAYSEVAASPAYQGRLP